ncbi:hypothetical protein UFOVP12_55 [uncultured Caudovirales phage]|uniref:Uncharacterized protein n=1 Tax=uncultured Caudovirales phage TaxID=2100421 RepID=A0A6J5KHB8_9CAUD|nr:hypothetical protein UFOVP12_55 [uncultured Caudovirales phage]
MTAMDKAMGVWAGGKNALISDEQCNAFEAGWLAALQLAVQYCLERKGYGTSDECAAMIMSLHTEVILMTSTTYKIMEDPKTRVKDPKPREWN